MVKLTEQQIEAQIDKAIARQSEIDAVEPRAKQVIFTDDRFTIYFNNEVTFSFLAKTIEAIAQLSTEELATVELTPSGKGLRWDKPDIDLSIQGLLLGIFGSNLWMKQIASKGGTSTSEKKQLASRINGKKGGRPRKTVS